MATAVMTRDPAWVADDVWVDHFEQKTDEALITQIKSFENEAETHLKKANRCWARAKNDWGGENYYWAKKEYKKAETCALKAEELRKMLAARHNTKMFTGMAVPTELLRNLALMGAAFSAGLTLVECVGNCADAEETLKKTISSAGSSYGSIQAGGAVSGIVTEGMKLLKISSTAAGAGGILVGMLASSVVAEVGREVVEELLGGNTSLSDLLVAAEIGFYSWEEKVEEATDPIRDRIADRLEWVSERLSDFEFWLNTL